MNVSMNDDDQPMEAGESENQTQTQTQSVGQPGSSQLAEKEDLDAQSWGRLVPCISGLAPVRFLKTSPVATIGRDSRSTLHLPWMGISKNRSRSVALLQVAHGF